MFRGTDDSRAGAPAGPRALHGPRLEVGVREPIFGEHVARPLIGLLWLGRASEPRTDAVRQVFEIGHQFAVLANFAENLRIGRSEGTSFVAAGFDQAASHGDHDGDDAEHKHTDSTQVHSSTSTEFWNFD